MHIDDHPVLTWVGDTIYWLLQRIDKTHRFAKLAKKSSKTFLRCAKKVEDRSVEHARRKACDAVCCGHTHQPVVSCGGAVPYFNGGCWTEHPGTYLTVTAGHVELHHFALDHAEIPTWPAAEGNPGMRLWTGTEADR
jgi:UDP-2,3-diacylglucosamine pyrophosphatase LpxH